MEYRILGKTGLKISVLGFGCMRLPVSGREVDRIDEKEATKMIRYAIDRGVNYFDTAYTYHSDDVSRPGASEPFLAKALLGGYREKVHLATKLPSWLVASREDMDRFLDEQLARLETGTIDFYLLHSLNRSSWENLVHYRVFDFLERAQKTGKIGHAGFSFHDSVDLFREIIDAHQWDFCQIMYNYFDEDYQAGKEGLRYAGEKGIPVVVMEPLRGGALVNGLPREAGEILAKEAPGRSEADWALRWLWRQPEVSVVLSGMSHMDQVKENVELAATVPNSRWTERDTRAIEQVNRILHNRQRVSCTSCGYCMPCPHGVDIPRNFTLCNDHHMLSDPGAKTRYFRLLKESQRASGCIRCGECLEKCPQQIPIPDELEYVAELFGG
ncbi:MAG: aldo/keto reductase [Bacteroidales bacterium]